MTSSDDLVGPTLVVSNGILSGMMALILVVGGVGNIFSLHFFTTQRPVNTTSVIFRMISLIDLMTCLLVLPVLVTFSANKSDVVFGYPAICTSWAFLNNLTTLLSMFLVGVLSVSRSLTLVRPACHITARAVVSLSLGYAVVLVAGICSVPLWCPYMKYSYTPDYGYCTMHVDSGADMKLYFKLISLFLFVPVIPVCGSCILSSYHLRKSLAMTRGDHVVTSLKLHATLTILVVTVIYIIFNMPLFVYLSLHYHKETFLSRHLARRQQDLLRVLLDIVCVGLNATINPVVYLATMNTYRAALTRLLGRNRKEDNSVI